jgi:hypothetical protein
VPGHQHFYTFQLFAAKLQIDYEMEGHGCMERLLLHPFMYDTNGQSSSPRQISFFVSVSSCHEMLRHCPIMLLQDIYDDDYDDDYVQPQLDPGMCLPSNLCKTFNANDFNCRPPLPVSSDTEEETPASDVIGNGDSKDNGPDDETPELNAFDSADGMSYDPLWGEGPQGETLCDAPPFKAFNYYGMVVRDRSSVALSGSSVLYLQDQSRVFFVDSNITIEDQSSLVLRNSTMVLINSKITVNGKSRVSYLRKALSVA